MTIQIPKVEILHDALPVHDADAFFEDQPRFYRSSIFNTMVLFLGLSIIFRLFPIPLQFAVIGAFLISVVWYVFNSQKRVKRKIQWDELQARVFNQTIPKLRQIEGLDIGQTYFSKAPVCSFLSYARDQSFVVAFSMSLTCDVLKIPVACIKEISFGLASEILDKETVESLNLKDQYVLLLSLYEQEVVSFTWVPLGTNEVKAQRFYAQLNAMIEKVDKELKQHFLTAEDACFDQQVEEISDWLEKSEHKSIRGLAVFFAIFCCIPAISAYTLGDSIERPFSVLISGLFTLGFFWSPLKVLGRRLLDQVTFIKERAYNKEGKQRLLHKLVLSFFTLTLAIPFGFVVHRALLNSLYPVWVAFSADKEVTAVVHMHRDMQSINPFRKYSIYTSLPDGQEFRYYLRPSQFRLPKEGKYLVRISGPRDVLEWSIRNVCILVDPDNQPIPASSVLDESLDKEAVMHAKCLE